MNKLTFKQKLFSLVSLYNKSAPFLTSAIIVPNTLIFSSNKKYAAYILEFEHSKMDVITFENRKVYRVDYVLTLQDVKKFSKNYSPFRVQYIKGIKSKTHSIKIKKSMNIFENRKLISNIKVSDEGKVNYTLEGRLFSSRTLKL